MSLDHFYSGLDIYTQNQSIKKKETVLYAIKYVDKLFLI